MEIFSSDFIVCACVCVCHSALEEVRGQLPSFHHMGQNSGHWVWQRALAAEPSPQCRVLTPADVFSTTPQS